MFLALLLTVLGSSIGSLLAVGTAWAGIKRYYLRIIARRLANGIAPDLISASVMASNQSGSAKVEWLVDTMRDSAKVDGESSVLDVAGGTHFDFVEKLAFVAKRVCIYDGKHALDYLSDKRPLLLQNNKITIKQGEDLVDEIPALQDATFDVVVMVDLLHKILPSKRQEAMHQWISKVKPDGGRMVLVIEEDPLTDVSQAGVVQGIFHRMNISAVKALLGAEGLTVYDSFRFPQECRIALVAKRGQITIGDS